MKKIAADRNYRILKRANPFSDFGSWILEEAGLADDIRSGVRSGMAAAERGFRTMMKVIVEKRASKSQRPGETYEDAFEREMNSALMNEFAPGLEAKMKDAVEKAFSVFKQ